MDTTVTHKHHIVPKHMGGSNHSSNITILSISEHAEAHRVLWEQNGKLEDKMAWLMLSGKTDEGECVRREMARDHMSRLWRDQRDMMVAAAKTSRAGLPGVMTGMYHSDASKEKMRAAKLGRPGTSKGKTVSPETRARISATLKRKGITPPHRAGATMVFSDAHKRHISESLTGKRRSDTSRQRQSESRKGLRWRIENGKRTYYKEVSPEGYVG